MPTTLEGDKVNIRPGEAMGLLLAISDQGGRLDGVVGLVFVDGTIRGTAILTGIWVVACIAHGATGILAADAGGLAAVTVVPAAAFVVFTRVADAITEATPVADVACGATTAKVFGIWVTAIIG